MSPPIRTIILAVTTALLLAFPAVAQSDFQSCLQNIRTTALAQGVPASQLLEPAADSAQFDSESLWARLQGLAWQAASVLMVRGETGREWLADKLRAHGARVDDVCWGRGFGVPRGDTGGGELFWEGAAVN